MSSKQTAPDSGLQCLIDEGYEVEVRQQHLLVRSIPYVTANRTVKRGTLVCKYLTSGSTVLPPSTQGDTHQVWWAGEYPCFADGKPIAQMENEHTRQELFKGCMIDHRFSNKPDGFNAFNDHHQKVTHYINLIQAQAKVLEPESDARTGHFVEAEEGESVFQYADTASARAEIMMVVERLAQQKIAIVGVGGTGSYVLDQVAKTPVKEIHLFDGDLFLQHNAFRTPGAATREEIEARQPKAEYLQQKYSAMHRGVVSHAYELTTANIAELNGFDFVFVCVDNGNARKLIHGHLLAQQISFVDVGMNLQLVPKTFKLIGTSRVTLATSKKNDHLTDYIPLDANDDDVLYRQNIQVADMNALNAQLAVMKWKQHSGFYHDDFQPMNLLFTINHMTLTRPKSPEATPA